MKILIIGNANSSMYLNGHARWLKLAYGQETVVDLFSTHPIENDKKNEPLLFDHLFFAYTKGLLSKIPGVKRKFLMPLNFRALPDSYDIIQVHYVSSFLKTIAPYFHQKSKKVVTSFWGSDFYKESNKSREKIAQNILKYSDAITLGNPEMIDHFKQFYYPKFQNPELCFFGNDLIEQMQLLKETNKFQSKNYLQFDAHKITITLSYNASQNNQHLKILESFSSNEYFLSKKDQVELIVPLTYGGTKEYLASIQKKLNELPFSFQILDTFLTPEQVFHLRNATDIFIHLPLSDALSGSLREHLFAKNLVITGNWLPYRILKSNSIYIHQLNSIEELPQKLNDLLANFDAETQHCLNNPSLVYNISSWQAVITGWVELYNKLLRN